MKRNDLRFCMLAFLFYFCLTSFAAVPKSLCDSATNGSVSRVEYICLSPLDTAALPELTKTKSNMSFLANLLEGNMVWDVLSRTLKRHHYSDQCTQEIQQTLYKVLRGKTLQLPCRYPSVQPDGDTLWVSGKVILPYGRELKGIVLASHFTIGSNREAPSASCPYESIFATKGYAVVMADYVGFGVSVERTHPYLVWRSAAKTMTDFAEALPNLLAYYDYSFPREIISYGYSEGGPVALGVAELVEQTLPDWQLKAVYAGAGPYDVAATYDYCVGQDSTGIPCAIPMLVMGTSAGYDLHLRKEDFFSEPLVSHYEEWVESKQYTVNQIDALLQSNRLSRVMTVEGRDKTQPETARFYSALQQSSLLGYVPQCQTYLFHSTEDDMVPFVNSEHLRSSLADTTRVTFDFAPYGTHAAACILFLEQVYKAIE